MFYCLPLPWAENRLQQQVLAGGVSEPEESAEAVGDDYEGVDKDGRNSNGIWDYV